MSRGAHIVAEIFNHPWLILRAKLEQIAQLAEHWESGERLTKQDIEARVGKRSESVVPRSEGSVAVIPIYGILAPKMNLFMEFSGGTSIQQLTEQFRAALADPNVKAIAFDVDSPGGNVYGVDELAAEIFSARGKKPMVAQVSPMAASAAYYLASQADEIAVTPTGEVGSIGVYAVHRDVSGHEKNAGVKTTLISAGKYKTEGSPYEPLGDEARAYMQERVEDYYGMFVAAVARGRNVNGDSVRNGMGQGRMVGAKQAVTLGMADRVATLEQTVGRLMERTGTSSANFVSQLSSPANQPEEAAAAASVLIPEGGIAAVVAAGVPVVASLEVGSLTLIGDSRKTGGSIMEATATAAAATAAVDTGALMTARSAQIATLALRHNMSEKLSAWISSGKTVQEVQEEILASLTPRAIPAAAASVSITSQHTTDRLAKVPGGRFARCVRALAANKGDLRAAARFAQDSFQDPYCAAALGGSTGSQGGFIVPDDMANEIIEFLRPQTVVRGLNPVLAPMPKGSLTLPKLAGGATASYIGENQNLPVTNPTFGQVKLAAKKLAALVPVSNDLVRYTGGGLQADILVRDDLASAIAQAEDQAFIRGAGTAYTPKGIRNWAPAANVIASNQTITLINVRQDLGKLRKTMRGGNVRFLRTGWIMSPRTETFLMNLADAQGRPVFYDEMTRRTFDTAGGGPGADSRGSGTGTFWGYPYKVTTLIPENLNTGVGSESELYFCDFADVVIGEVPTMVIETSTEAAYFDGTTVQAAFSLDQTVIRMIMEHDLAVRHPESITILSQVTWT